MSPASVVGREGRHERERAGDRRMNAPDSTFI